MASEKPLLTPKERDAVVDQFFTDDEGDLSQYRKRLPYPFATPRRGN
jgi:hypothetical protein